MRRTREETRAETRAAILAAARTLFAEHGFVGASLDDIAARADLTKGAIYSNWSTKEDLFFEVVKTVMADPDPAVLERRDLRLPEVLVEYFLSAVRRMQRRDRSAAVLEFELAVLAARNESILEDLTRRRTDSCRWLGAYIEARALEEGFTLRCSGSELAAMLVGATQGLLQQWLLAPRLGPRRLFEATLATLVDGLLAPSGPS